MPPPHQTARLPATLIVLAGGSSRRMKRNKAVLPAPDKPLLLHVLNQVEEFFAEILISVSRGQRFDFLPFRTVEDEAPGQGPLAGILSGLKAAANDTCVVIACDIPEININFLLAMIKKAEGYEILVPCSGENKYEPLFAVYKKSVIPKIEALISSQDFSILSLFPLCRTRLEKMRDASWLRNLNTPGDYQDYLKSQGRWR